MSHSKKNHQRPLNIDEQVENLKLIGLTLEDDEYAKNVLNDISYFRLIKAYSYGLKPRNSNYPEGVSFNQILELYLFNANLRQLIFSEIERIEVNFRCRLGNHHSYHNGAFGYRDPSFFIDPDFHARTMDDIDREIQQNSRSPFIRNFMDNYIPADIPLYAAVEIFSFGTLSKLYKNMLPEDKKLIATSYSVKYTYLESWLESLAYVRNICAHYGRLYNAKLTKTPRLYMRYKKKGISNNRIFGVLCCMKHLVPADCHWTNFVDKIEALFAKYPSADKSTMGFPDNWKEILNEQEPF